MHKPVVRAGWLCFLGLVVATGGCSGTPEVGIAEDGAGLGNQADTHMRQARALLEQGKPEAAVAELTAATNAYFKAAQKMREALRVRKERLGTAPGDPYDEWSLSAEGAVERLEQRQLAASLAVDRLKARAAGKEEPPAGPGGTPPASRRVDPLAPLPPEDDVPDGDALFLSAGKFLFFEGDATPPPQPTPATRFHRSSARRIHTRVEIENAIGNARDLKARLVLRCTRADGSPLGIVNVTATIPGGSESFTIEGSFGSDAPGRWEPGACTVQVEAGGVPIGAATFTIEDQ